MVFLFLLWIIFNAKVTLEILFLGLIVSAGVYCFLCRFFSFHPRLEWMILKNIPKIICYVAVLLWEILLANIQVSKLILFQKRKLEPAIVSFTPALRSDFARVVLANSITLTPGTITVSLKNGHYWVHCLDKSLAEGLEHSVFVRLLKKMEKV